MTRFMALLVASTVLAQGARAADLDHEYLRGSQYDDVAPSYGLPGYDLVSPAYPRWDGVYGGVHGGYAGSNSNFGNATSDLIAYILRNTTVENEAHVSTLTTLPTTSTGDFTYGGFIGYNWQWEDAVLGVEVSYNHSTDRQSAADTLNRSLTTSDGYFNDIHLDTSASIAVKDYATIRGRAAYAFGSFLPYATVGVAVGDADIIRSATVVLTQTQAGFPTLGLNQTRSTNSNTVVYGFSAGVGMDVALTQNVFLRGEYEYVHFVSPSNVDTSINTARAGVGLKF